MKTLQDRYKNIQGAESSEITVRKFQVQYTSYHILWCTMQPELFKQNVILCQESH